MARAVRRRPPLAGRTLASLPSRLVIGLPPGYADRIGSR